MPDGLSGLLITCTSVVQQRSTDNIEACRSAYDLWSISNAYDAARVLVLLDWLAFVYGVLFSHAN
jgi:hypothetical protein